TATARCDGGRGHEQVLAAIHLVHHGRSDEVATEPGRPELLASGTVPGTDLVVAACAEHQARGGDDHAIEQAGRAGAGDAARGQVRVITEADAPLDARLVQVVLHDGGERRRKAVAHRVVFIDRVLLP